MAENCPGSCNRQAREKQALYEAAIAAYDAHLETLGNGDPVPDPPERPCLEWWPGDPVWCRKCAAKIRVRLAELDELAASLAGLPPGVRPASAHGDHVRVHVSYVHRSPAPPGDDLDYLQWWLLSWESAYRDSRGWGSAPPRGVMASTVTSACNWLGMHLGGQGVPGILACEFAGDFGAEVILMHAQLRAVANAAAEYQHLPRPCPKCRRYLLFQKAGEPLIVCHYEPSPGDRCGCIWTLKELDYRAGRGAA